MRTLTYRTALAATISTIFLVYRSTWPSVRPKRDRKSSSIRRHRQSGGIDNAQDDMFPVFVVTVSDSRPGCYCLYKGNHDNTSFISDARR